MMIFEGHFSCGLLLKSMRNTSQTVA